MKVIIFVKRLQWFFGLVLRNYNGIISPITAWQVAKIFCPKEEELNESNN